MLVGAYPFERPEDKHDNQKLQKMIQVYTCLTLCEAHLMAAALQMTCSCCITPNTCHAVIRSSPNCSDDVLRVHRPVVLVRRGYCG